MPPLGGAPHHIPHVDAPVVQNTVGGGDVLIGRHRVGLDLCHASQSGQYAPAILVAQSPLDVVLLIKLRVDVVLLFPLLLQGQNSGRDLTVCVFAVFSPDHGAALLSA